MNKPVLKALAAAAFALHAAPGLALDLMGAYHQAAAHDPTLAAANQALTAGREKTVQGRSLLLPQVQLASSATHVSDRSSSANLPPPWQDVVKPNGSGTMHEVALELKQPIIAAKSRAEKKQLEQQTALAEIQYREAQQDLVQRVAQVYLNVLLAEESLRVTRAEKAAVALQRDRAQARFDVGRGRITDLQEAQARLDSVGTREVQSEGALALRRTQFEELTGAKATDLAALHTAGFAPQAPQPDDPLAWQLQAAAGHPRVLAKQAELAIAGVEVDKYALAARPTLDLVASASYRSQSGGLSELSAPDGKRSTAIGLQFSVPLYAGGAIRSKERESMARRHQSEHELAAAQRDARVQAQDAYLSVKTGVSRVGSLEQSARSAATALEATTLGRDLGTRTELDVLDAQQRLFTAQLDLAQARNDYLIGRIKLAAAAGALQPADLQALNNFLITP